MAFRKFVTSPTPYIIIKVLWRGKSSPYYILRSGGSEGSGATPFGGKGRAKEAEVGISLSAKPNEP